MCEEGCGQGGGGRAAEGKTINSLPCSVKKLRSIPTGNGKPSMALGETSNVKFERSFFSFPGREVYSYFGTLYNSLTPLKRKKKNLSEHMDTKSVPLISLYTIWHPEFLDE